ncbi:unnamed protein product [Hermetia illucens]|uniref:Gustatory receptor n=1 Tax=Hermetia illucens TaxID=343691 RepID=A0A7R8Z0E3_HERIL|nr:uncharacterized protein LOC119657929 [Hermetia illucens]CAD7090933.1 unnamed protein product [Hermetia illucens]
MSGYWFLVSVATYIATVPTTLFYVIMLLLMRFHAIFNYKLKLLTARLKQINDSSDRDSQKMTQCCECSDLLDYYSNLLSEIHNLIINTKNIFQFQILIIFSKTYVTTVSRTFYVFMLIHCGRLSPNSLIHSICYAFLTYVNEILCILVVTITTDQSSETAKHIQKANQYIALDGRLRKDLNMFSILLLLKRYHLKLCGMIPFDRKFILSVTLSAIIHFLLLVQYHDDF